MIKKKWVGPFCLQFPGLVIVSRDLALVTFFPHFAQSHVLYPKANLAIVLFSRTKFRQRQAYLISHCHGRRPRLNNVALAKQECSHYYMRAYDSG
ncbi:hypothetical protein EDB92DRAFT_1883512 [Lactarius akahatsu]|uniref:Uncharacterized protein n=1 Tax=Lactarius akahatsu TaxID=416441 RepID=A0AAD4L9A4_9AGAM|nr:hypothetical protein EDB92DRAFT_1883512 [Lactarius akahatsu]